MERTPKKLISFTITLIFAILVCSAASAASADIQVNQTVNNYTPNLNDNVTFNTTVTNKGPDTATGVQITNKLPSGVSFNNYTASQGTYNSTTGIWDVGTLTNGQIATLLLNTQVTQTGIIKDIANKTAETETDPNLDNNSQETILNVPNAVDVSVNNYPWYYDKSTGTYLNRYAYGVPPVMIVDVRNSDQYDEATGVTVNYVIGNGLKYIDCFTRGIGTTQYSNGILTWTIGKIPAGGAVVMYVFLEENTTGNKTTNQNTTAILTHVDQKDVNPANNQTSYAFEIKPAADIQVNQTTTTTTPNYNSTVTFTITVKNNGPNNATGVQIEDLLPTGLTWVSDTGSNTYDHTTGIWNIGNLDSGATAILKIVANVTATGTLKNSAYTKLLTLNDWNYDNNNQTIILNVNGAGNYTPQVDVSVNNYPWYYDKSTGTYLNRYAYGVPPVMIVDVRNSDQYDEATGVTVNYVIGNGLKYIDCFTRGIGTTQYSNGILTWTIGKIPAGGAVVMYVFLEENTTGNKTTNQNTTAILTHVDQKDVNPANNQTSYAFEIKPAADIQVNQTTTTTTPNYNSTVTFTITVKNNGPNNATGVQIEDLLPTGLTWVSDTGSNTYDHTTGIWNIGNLDSGATAILKIVANVTATGTLKNSAYTKLLTLNDWNYDNNNQTIILTVPDASDIGVSQTINNTSPNVNDNITITLNATNYGPDYATNIKISDILPSGLEYVSSSTNHGNFTNSVWTIQNLLSGSTATLTIIVKAINMGNFTNTANLTKSTQYDWNNSNNITSVNLEVTGTIPSNIFTNQGTQSGTINKDDGTTTAITLPFTITLYGQTYNTIYISVNGAIGLGAPIQGPMYYQLPESNPVNKYVAYIAPFWADLDVAKIGSITYLITNNQVNITWYQVPCHTDNQNSNRVNTLTLIITNQSTYAFIYGDLDWKNDPSDYYTSYARISKGDDGETYKNFWTGDQELNELANKTIWFDSNGNIISPTVYADIAVTQTAGSSSIYYWDTTTLTITVTNKGTSQATGIQITEVLPSQLDYVSYTSSSGTTYNYRTGVWNIGTLDSGKSVTLIITVRGANTGTGTSTATKTAENQYDPVASNNEASTTVRVRSWW